jgi:hypothetical protein
MFPKEIQVIFDARTALEAAKGGEEAAKGWGKVTGGLAAVGVAMALPVGAAVKEFATFDQAMSGVASTGDDARASIDQLNQELSKRSTYYDRKILMN